jgi:hypothetical protein
VVDCRYMDFLVSHTTPTTTLSPDLGELFEIQNPRWREVSNNATMQLLIIVVIACAGIC